MTVWLGYPVAQNNIVTWTVTGNGNVHIPTGTLNFSYGDVFVSFSNAESTGTRQLTVSEIIIDGTTILTNGLSTGVYDSFVTWFYGTSLACTTATSSTRPTSYSSTPVEDVLPAGKLLLRLNIHLQHSTTPAGD